MKRNNQKIWKAISKNPWYNSYRGAKERCENKNHKSYKYYGGKGVKFLLSKEDIKELWFRDKAYLMDRPSIDREKSNGNYEYGNCGFIENRENIGKKNKEHATHILQYGLDGTFIKEWSSITSAINEHSSAIQHCLRNETKTSCGFIWVYKKNKINNKLTKDTMTYHLTNERLVSVNQFDSNGVFIKNWRSIADACLFYKTSPSNINGVLNNGRKTAVGYIWVYSN